MANNLYNESSIESLDPREFTRLKPFVYCGSTEYATQLLVEGFSNSLDEVNLGHGSVIKIDISGDLTYTLEDEGQGFIINQKREDGKTILEAAFSVINTSGKYRSDGTYEGTSLGAFGIGSKLICFLSSSLEVETYRDGQFEKIWFKDGLFERRQTGKSNHHSGTKLIWKPDPQFFNSIDIELDKIRNLFKTISCLSQGLKIEFTYKESKTEVFQSSNGLQDLVDEAVKDKELLKRRMTCKQQIDKLKIDLIMTYTSSYSPTMVAYVNNGLTESGPHIVQLKTILTRELNKYFKDNKILKEKDENFSGEEIQEGLYMVFNITAPEVKYDAQIKSRVTGINCKELFAAFAESLKSWLSSNGADAKIIAEKALLARAAREKARKAKEAVRDGKERQRRKVINPDKLKDAETLGQNSILLCVEGNSAASSMAVARDTQRYGILGLRGKPLNLLTNDSERAAKNEEIQLLISALGITPGKYNSSDLRYGKIAITSDSDADGFHIGLLIASALLVLCPEFIQEGRLCWLRSPLYIVKNGKKESYYYTDKEMNAARSTIKGEVQRNKGLGSLTAEQARVSMFTEEYQRLDVLEYSDEAIQLLKDLMGDSVDKRKKFIFNNINFAEVHE